MDSSRVDPNLDDTLFETIRRFFDSIKDPFQNQSVSGLVVTVRIREL